MDAELLWSRMDKIVKVLITALAIWTSLCTTYPVKSYQPGVTTAVTSLKPRYMDNIFLPIIHNNPTPQPSKRINIPYFPGWNVTFDKMAIFWFGAVTPSQNYTDVRIAYTDHELVIHAVIFDRRIWYDPSQTPTNHTNYDSVSFFLHVGTDLATLPTPHTYRFDTQTSSWEPRPPRQASFQGTGTNWQQVSIPYVTESSWKGAGANQDVDNRGWHMEFKILFEDLGISSPPAQGTTWRLGITVHDRDTATGPMNPDTSWPTDLQPNNPSNWSLVRFGMPGYSPSSYSSGGNVEIRRDLSGTAVLDAMVGGGSRCGYEFQPYFENWGGANYSSSDLFDTLVEQNQGNYDDWPCFSKIFLTFPLSQVPTGKVIVAATLKLWQFGNSDPTKAQRSYIQVSRVDSDWSELAITWNNAPKVYENYDGAWVDPIPPPGYDFGLMRTWDISRAVHDAYTQKQPLRLALYSADYPMHSGKYFWSSEIDQQTGINRQPTVQITWGEPAR